MTSRYPLEPPPENEDDLEPGSGRSRRSQASGVDRKVVLWVLGGLVLAIPTINLPNQGVWLGVKAFALETIGILLAVFVVSRGEWTRERVRGALLAPPNLAILGFLAWVGLSAALSKLPNWSRYEAMRHLGGGLIYFAVVYGLSVRRNLGSLITILLVAGSLGAILAFVNLGELDTNHLAGAFRNTQLLGGFLCLIMPLVLMASQTDDEPWRRIAAQVSIVIVVGALLMARNRSAWAGSGVAVAVMVVLHLIYGRDEERGGVRRHELIVPVLMVVLAVGLFFSLSQASGGLTERLKSVSNLGQDLSFNWRLGMWDKALRMVRDRPLMGWGVGLFPLQQSLYYHPACASARTQLEIFTLGPSLSENAHNTYLQLAAELGIPGIILYLGIFGAFFTTALRALPRLRPGFPKSMLIATVGAIAAQMVGAVGSPAWEFAECSLFLWLVLGMGMALAGVGEWGREPTAGAAIR
jgi:O-antigen ligase